MVQTVKKNNKHLQIVKTSNKHANNEHTGALEIHVLQNLLLVLNNLK